jgi:glycerol-3-phosphate dehydrogenase (NAD(P)+)
MSQVIVNVIGPAVEPRIAVISGPTFAPEVARGVPTALVVASPLESCEYSCSPNFRHRDFALYQRRYDRSGESALRQKTSLRLLLASPTGWDWVPMPPQLSLPRGLAEITRLAVACGGRRETLSGLAGSGRFDFNFIR